MNWRKYLVKPFYFKNIDESKYTLENILEFASTHTKYYSKFGKGLKNYPVLTKDILRKELDNLKSDDLDKRKWFFNTSGGSTGEPVRFIQDMEFRYIQRKIAYEQKSWTGYEFGELMIKLWGNEKEILSDKKNYKAMILDWLKNVKFLNTFKMGEKEIKNYINFFNENPPKLIVAYVQSIYQIAKYIKNNNLKAPKIPAIMTTAGNLYSSHKKLIEEVFNTKVFNRYGSREVGSIACSKEGEELYVNKYVWVEVLTENGEVKENGKGELLITSLTNYAMPLIRYKIGDIGEVETKNNQQIIKKLYGRDVDVFKTKEGDLIDGEYFSHLFYFMDWIYKYQVVQKDYDYIVVKIATKKPNKKDMELIKKGIEKVMGKCKVEFEIVDDIPELSSGKFRYTISEIKD